MENRKLKNEFLLEEQSIVDDCKVFYFNDNVYRAIFKLEQAELYRRILASDTLKEAMDLGLVQTKICNTISFKNSSLILQHQRIDFFSHPSEMTDAMYWNLASTLIKLCKSLAKSGLILQDAHPWNMTFASGKVVFFDFSSIAESVSYTESWFKEFYTYFAVPLWLAACREPGLAEEYRRQHLRGLGIKLSSLTITKKLLFRSFFKLSKKLSRPEEFLDGLEKWINRFKPRAKSGVWDKYEQSHNNVTFDPKTSKQKFVYDILVSQRPKKVIDLAANKGYYSFVAENLGASVIGFDYEASSVDAANEIAKNKNATFCLMDFKMPTPAFGWGLIGPDSFSRFRSDIALALGLIHHICLVQRFPVKLFCNTCARYSSRGVILEFVYPDDIHVQSWNIQVPQDYSIESIKEYFSDFFGQYAESAMFLENGSKRQFLFFYGN